MKCLIAVKRVIDFTVKVRLTSDHKKVETEHVKMSLNPFDEIALEEGLRQKEAGNISEILVVSLGELSVQETLREALARGADRALLIETSLTLEPIQIAQVLKKIILDENCDCAFLGKQAIDDDCNQTGQMLSGLLNWSLGTNASKVVISKEQKWIDVTREIDLGLETLRLNLPSIVTVDLRLNEPRYISLPNLMKAKTKPLNIIPLADLNLTFNPHVNILQLEEPILQRKGIKVKSVQELIEKLKNEAKVI